MTVEITRDATPFLAMVITLARANKQTLGLMYDEAFHEAAHKRTLLVALDANKTCIGYLLYRTVKTKYRVTITHLCVERSQRGKGIARDLVDYLSRITQEYRGILSSCRRDYEASRVWPKMGFTAMSDRRGRSQDGKELTYWWRDHGHPTIFDGTYMNDAEPRLNAVIDANIFYDLNKDESREESKALVADWLRDSLELCVTEEILNEINRLPDSNERNRQRRFVNRYRLLHGSNDSFAQIFAALRPLFPESMSGRDESDHRQLSRAAAAGAPFFVTRDQALLNKRDPVYTQCGTTIIRPSDLIIHLDELRRQAEYQPARLAGTLLDVRLVRDNEQSMLGDRFLAHDQGENKGEFYQRLRDHLSRPERNECVVALDMEQNPLTLIVYERTSNSLEIPLFRIGDHPLGATLARHLVLRTVLLSATEHRSLTRVADPYAGKTVAAALQEHGFLQINSGWVKVNLAVAETARDLSRRLCLLAASMGQEGLYYNQLAKAMSIEGSTQDVWAMVDIERALWPAKVIDAAIPTFIIPIRPEWAQDLFDEQLAQETLMGADPTRVLNSESIYYRSARLSGLKVPARILWYVSKKGQYQGSGMVRACSLLDDIVIDKPKRLFKQFERLGVYKWDDVYKTADRDINKDIMAIRFSNTELFICPVSLDNLRLVMAQENCRSPLASPSCVTAKAFYRLYAAGTGKDRATDVS